MTAQDFIFNTPLYQHVQINKDNDFLQEIASNYGSFDGFNPLQKKETTYRLKSGLCYDNGNYKSNLIEESGFLYLYLVCSRYGDPLRIYIYWDADKRILTKIGQYPSVADIHIGQIKQYNKVLPEESLKEFTRAIGLAANGVGIGSFVYLRRIFEKLILNVAEAVIKAENRQVFDKARMNEKIDMLKDYLPAFLVDNKNIYGILSKGIHELSEETCLGYFDVMRNSIELILDQRLEEYKHKEKEEKAKKALNSINSTINKQL